MKKDLSSSKTYFQATHAQHYVGKIVRTLASRLTHALSPAVLVQSRILHAPFFVSLALRANV